MKQFPFLFASLSDICKTSLERMVWLKSRHKHKFSGTRTSTRSVDVTSEDIFLQKKKCSKTLSKLRLLLSQVCTF